MALACNKRAAQLMRTKWEVMINIRGWPESTKTKSGDEKESEQQYRIQFMWMGQFRTLYRQQSEKAEKFVHRLNSVLDPSWNKKCTPSLRGRGGKRVSWNGSQEANVAGTHNEETKNDAYKEVFNLVVFQDSKGEGISTKNRTLCEVMADAKQMVLKDQTYSIRWNPPKTMSLSCSTLLFVGVPIVPWVETEFCPAEECVWQWFVIHEDNEGEELVGNSRFYTPTIDQLQKSLRVVCSPTQELLDDRTYSTSSIVLGPVQNLPPRDIILHDRLSKMLQNVSADHFRVASYNILFDAYALSDFARKEMFPYCRLQYLEERHRLPLILQEILEYDSDILAVQEMGERTYRQYFHPFMAAHGFTGIYSGKSGSMAEGCALFVRNDAFDVIETHDVQLGRFRDCNQLDQGILHLLQEFPEIDKALKSIPSVAQFICLRDRRNPLRQMLVGNTHFYYRSDSNFIRLLQSAILLSFAESLQKKYPTSGLVLCGDFNSQPHTPAIEYFLHGFVDSTHQDWQSASHFRWNNAMTAQSSKPTEASCRQGLIPQKSPTTRVLKHPFHLSSACGMPTYTTFTEAFKATLDYIFIDPNFFNVTAVMPEIPPSYLSEATALPSRTFPSDHLAILAQLQWISTPHPSQ